MKYAKLWCQILVTVLLAVIAALAGDNVISSVEWINVAIVGVGAAAVFTGPNIPGAAATKSILSVLAAVLVILTSAITDGIQSVEIMQMVVAALGALGVYVIPNRGQTVSFDNTSI